MSDTCSICLGEMSEAEQSSLPCNHNFHPQCLATWLWTSQSCPVCRAQPFSTHTEQDIDYDFLTVIRRLRNDSIQARNRALAASRRVGADRQVKRAAAYYRKWKAKRSELLSAKRNLQQTVRSQRAKQRNELLLYNRQYRDGWKKLVAKHREEGRANAAHLAKLDCSTRSATRRIHVYEQRLIDLYA